MASPSRTLESRKSAELQQLRQRVAELERDLEQRDRELEDTRETLQRLAYITSHNLQESVRMISSYTDLLAKRYQGKLGPEADEFIDFAMEGVSRVQEFIRDLLEYSRATTRKYKLEATDTRTVLLWALGNIKPAMERTGAIVTYDSLPEVMADSSQLVQLFQHLLDNAIKFHGPEPPRIHISATRAEDQWVFSVRDNGIGIDPQYAKAVFMIFYRLHSRSKYPGTGIGLTICKKIVDRHGGRIWVESQPEEGSNFQFTIPA